MAFTTESMQPTTLGTTLGEPSQFNLPAKEFIGYDPKGTTTVTGTPVVRADVKEPEVKADPLEEVALSPKISAIARKEQAQRAKEKALNEKERTFSEKMADAEKYQQLKAKIAAKDYSAAEELGLTYEEYLKHEVNKEASKDPEKERVKQLEEKLSALEKAREEDTVKEYQANQALWKQEIVKVVKENDEFSSIRELEAEDIVLKHINDSFEEDDVELTVEQAAKEIEDALLARAEKFSSISKIKNKAPEGKVLGPPKTSPKTITQNMTTTPKTASMSKPFHLLSESEQIEEAIRRVQAAKLQR